jgi:cobalamin biosynthesis protein CobT
MIYFVVDEYDGMKEESQNQEDLNMNTEKDRKNDEAAENNAELNKYTQYRNSIEMSEVNDGKKEEQAAPKVNQSRHNLLSEGMVHSRTQVKRIFVEITILIIFVLFMLHVALCLHKCLT